MTLSAKSAAGQNTIALRLDTIHDEFVGSWNDTWVDRLMHSYKTLFNPQKDELKVAVENYGNNNNKTQILVTKLSIFWDLFKRSIC